MARPLLLLWLLALPLLTGATRIPLTVHLAQEEGEPVADRAWVEAALERANALWAPVEVSFELEGIESLESPGPSIEKVRERHALARHAPRDGTVHLFVVSRLADRSREGVYIAGVHWRYVGKRAALRGRRYIILSREAAGPDTAAHELGHFFGEGHAAAAGNLMKQQPRSAEVSLSEAQIDRLRVRVRRALARGILAPRRPRPVPGP